jgi:RNA polymerase sigma-70 factor (ECF subfamily)
MPDEDLLRATARGNRAAFEGLYGRYERRVFNYVRTFLRQPAHAEEVVIDTMMAIWNSAGTCQESARISTWIFGIARHKAIDAVRKARRHGDSLPLQDIIEPADPHDEPPDATASSIKARLMLQAIRQLSLDHQEILRLAFYEDLPYEEIASLLSIPDNTVKTRVYYAKQQLRLQLENLGVESAE